MSGTYAFTWKTSQAVPGDWTITATFPGSNSYGSSWAETHANLVEAQVTPTATTNTVNIGQTTADSIIIYIVGGVIALIIAIVIVGILLLRKK